MNHYLETAQLRTRDCDLNGVWRFSALLETLQEVAGAHCAELGWGRNRLMAIGMAWVLVRTEVRMERTPGIGETVCVETFHMPARHRLFPRYFILTDGTGARIGMASTLWMLMNLETREAASAESIGLALPDNRDMTPPMALPSVIRPLDGETKRSFYKAVYSDLDVNRHVNNTKYADWICNQLGEERLTKQEIHRMTLDYNAEVLPGQEVCFDLTLTENRCQLMGLHGEQKAFEIDCELRERTAEKV